jgi:hypothetical protein
MKQFSLRDLFFIVAIVALLLGWWVERRNFAAAPGRFQMQVVNGQAVLLDTATGGNATWTNVAVPYWPVALLFVTLAVAPWIPWSNRFSLRTLLIATMLIAVGLALVTWLNK